MQVYVWGQLVLHITWLRYSIAHAIYTKAFKFYTPSAIQIAAKIRGGRVSLAASGQNAHFSSNMAKSIVCQTMEVLQYEPLSTFGEIEFFRFWCFDVLDGMSKMMLFSSSKISLTTSCCDESKKFAYHLWNKRHLLMFLTSIAYLMFDHKITKWNAWWEFFLKKFIYFHSFTLCYNRIIHVCVDFQFCCCKYLNKSYKCYRGTRNSIFTLTNYNPTKNKTS